MHRLSLLLVVALLGVAAAGCGSDDSESAGDAAATTASGATAEPETMTAETDTEPAPTETGALATEECRKLIETASKLSTAFTAAGEAGDLKQSAKLFDSLADDAPDEIRDDLRVLSNAFSKYVEVLDDLDLKPGEVPSASQQQKLAEAAQSIDQQAVSEASARISQWSTANCGGG